MRELDIIKGLSDISFQRCTSDRHDFDIVTVAFKIKPRSCMPYRDEFLKKNKDTLYAMAESVLSGSKKYKKFGFPVGYLEHDIIFIGNNKVSVSFKKKEAVYDEVC